LLAAQRFSARPWIVFDFKRETVFDRIGFPPIRQISLSAKIPREPGLYLVSPRPGQDGFVDAFLWRCWERENVGLFIDELALMPDQSDALAAIYQQGRSKRIPVIGCSQRPVGVIRGVFSEASFFCVYRLNDRRDYKTIEGFTPADMSAPVPLYHWRWYDVSRNVLLHMRPCPDPETTADRLAQIVPSKPHAWHPFVWTGRTSGREPVKLNVKG
jgi:hypothetical protein